MYQEFDWALNELPVNADFKINFTTSLTGSFASEEVGQLMFRVYVWMIDSSGHWQQIMKTFPPYSDVYQERRADINYFDFLEIWGGMIENSSGLQEDPTDTVQVAVGLVPTHDFESHHAYEEDPWEFYDGSVSVRINSMKLFVYTEEDPDPSQVLSPLYNKTWDYSVRDVFPDIPVEYENDSRVEFRDIETDTDDSVYVLCKASSSYEMYVNQSKHFSYEFLLKYSPVLELRWSARNDNRTTPYAMTIHDGFIYTTGYIKTDDEQNNLIVTKWSPNGEWLWQTEWGGIYSEEGSAIAVSSDGSIYVWAAYYNRAFEPEFWKSSFLKFDSSGTLLWNKTSEIPLMPGWAELEMQPDGMYSWDTVNVEKRDFSYEPVWNISRQAFAVNFDDAGNIYIATIGSWAGPGAISDEWQVMVSKWNPTGAELWNMNYSIPLIDSSSLNFMCRSIDVAPEGSVIAILHEMELSYDYHMLKFDSSGNLLWDKIIGNERWPVYGAMEPKLQIGDNGLAYVGCNLYGDYGMEVAVSAFVIGPYDQDTNFPMTIVIVGISGAALVAVVIVVYIRKYRI